jgi:hypothetical protein
MGNGDLQQSNISLILQEKELIPLGRVSLCNFLFSRGAGNLSLNIL